MRRIVISKPGGHAALRLVTEPDPEPGPDRPRVRVAAAGVNYADAMVRMGLYTAAKGLYPITPGFEFAGVVDRAGGGFSVGERVFGAMRFGAYADVLCPDPGYLWRCPDGWTLEECAAFPAVYLTAFHGLFQVAKVEKGERLLVHSAAGGAGSAFARLARIAGCRVIGVVGSEAKTAAAQDAGCDQVIVRESADLWAEADRLAPDGFDAVFDANGLTTLRPGFDRLRAGGRLVIYGFAELLTRGADRPRWLSLGWKALKVPKFSPLEMTGSNRGVLGFNVVYLFERREYAAAAMARMLEWIANGLIPRPAVRLYPLADAARAHAALESGATTGKLVLTS